MRRALFYISMLAVLIGLACIASAQPIEKRPVNKGFDFGGGPEFDRPPLARNEAEKRALAVLDEMSKGRWYLNVTAREGRLLRQLIDVSGAKCVVEIGTSSGYSTIWLALGVRATGGKL
jgi:hypothetical protein